MNTSPLLAPLLVQMLLTALVWLYMFATRIPFITRNQLTAQQLQPLEFARISPPPVANPSDNLKNLFELPVLFYALGALLMITQRVDTVYVTAAWVFVAFRVLHSLIHCTVNAIMPRFYAYLVASLALWFMLLRCLWQLF